MTHSALVIALSVCWVGPALGQLVRQPVHGGGPSVSPDGALIAFASERGGTQSLFVIAPDGTREKQVTQGEGQRSYPQWAPDGKDILFAMTADGSSRLLAVSIAGGEPREIGRFPGRLAGLLPDRSRVIASVGPYRQARLVISKLDGSGAVELTGGTPPAWTAGLSPDGAQFAFPRNDGESHVWVMRPDGTSLRQVTRIKPSEGHTEWPAWSPDGRRLAVQVGRRVKDGESTSHIWTVELATGEATKLAPHDRAYLDETPSWFPDGKRIAFQSDRTGRMEIWSMNADGTDPRQITH